MTTTPPGDYPPPHGGQYGGQPPGGGHQPPGGGYPPSGPFGQSGGDDRTIAILAHLSPLIALVLSAGWLSFAGPLIVWLIWRERGPLVRNAAVSAFNFTITVWVTSIVAWLLLFTIILIPVSIVLWIVAFIAQLVLSIKGAMAASRGEVYRYPFQIRILN